MIFSNSPFWLRAKDFWNELTEQQRDFCKLGGGLVVAGVLTGAGWLWGRPVWQRWQRTQAVEQAQSFAQKNDYRSAALALRRAIELAPNDPATWKEAVEVLAAIGSPEVLLAREQLARLTPNDVAVKLALAGDALRFDRIDLARSALTEVRGAAERDAAFYRLAVALALSMGRADEVEANLAALVAAAPGDVEARFNQAVVRLWSVDEAKVALGRRELEALTAEREVRVRAAVELLKEAARQRDGRRAKAIMEALQARFRPGSSGDFDSPGLPGWVGLLEALRQAAAERGEADVAVLARWLADLGQRREALVWIEGLPGALGASPRVADVAAELSAELGDLDRLELRLRAGAWGVWPRDVLTLAIGSRLQRLRYNEANGRATWNDALTAAGESPDALRALVRLAQAWGDADGVERALVAVIQRDPKRLWAYTALRDIYAARLDLGKQWQLHDQWVRQVPADAALVATWAVLGALVNRVPADGSERLLAVASGDQTGAVTVARAACAWRQGHAAECLSLLAALPAVQRDQPAVALWEGLAAADLGRKREAQTALLRAWRPGLSAEETTLLRAAAAKINLRLP